MINHSIWHADIGEKGSIDKENLQYGMHTSIIKVHRYTHAGMHPYIYTCIHANSDDKGRELRDVKKCSVAAKGILQLPYVPADTLLPPIGLYIHMSMATGVRSPSEF